MLCTTNPKHLPHMIPSYTMNRLAALCLILCALIAPSQAEPAHVVFLAGGKSHGPGEHEFHAGCQILAKALNEQSGLAITASVHKGWPADPTILDQARTIVIYADGTSVVGKGWDKIDALAKKGTSLVFMHYAVHPNATEGEKYYRPWIGGAFETGWSVNPHWVADLKTLPEHPVSRGVSGPLEAYDEFYYNIRFPSDRSKVLNLVTATPTRPRIKRYINLWNEHGVAGIDQPQTLMWGIQRADGGRGVGFTGGHYHRNWSIDGFRKLVLNAITWASGLEVPAEGVKSLTVSEEQLNLNLDDKGANKPRITIPTADELKSLPPAEIQKDRESKFAPAQTTPPTSPSTKAQATNTPANPNPLPQTNRAPLFLSPVLTATSKDRIISVDVSLKDVSDLYLHVDSNGPISCDWADWLNPRLIMADGSSKDLTTLDWVSAKSGYGSIRKNRTFEGSTLKVAGKPFEKGIGAHATSTIHFALPHGTARFQAEVAIDDGGMIRNGRPSEASLRFAILAQPPSKLPPIEPVAEGPTVVPVDLFTVPEGLEVTLWATSPLLQNPTNIDFDEKGRLWVAEGVNYRGKAGRRPDGDRIVILEDTDQDGKADRSSVFVQEPHLASPLGVAVLDNRIVVSQPPDLIVYTDVNRDGKFDPSVDTREVLLTGFNGRQHDHSLHSVTAGPDGLWYWNQGNCGAVFTDRSGKTFRMGSGYMTQQAAGLASDDGNVWIGGFTARMNPDGSNVTIIGHNYRNSYEQTVTSLGDLFQSDNDDPPACRVTPIIEGGNAGFSSIDGKRAWAADRRPGQDVPTAEWRQEDPGTMPAGDVYGGGSPTGVGFYENGALDPKWNGLLLACEAGKNVVFGYLPKPDGAGWKLERFDFLTSNKEREWAGSDFLGGKANSELKTKFRPSDVCVGPDGAIYVADWFDARVGGHGTMDNAYTGAIYRIAPKGFKSVIPKIDLSRTEGQIAALKSPSPNVRNLGFNALKRSGKNAIPALTDLAKDANPYLAARAVWILAQLGADGIQHVTPLLKSQNHTLRLVAYRALRRVNHEVITMAKQMATDPDAAVRREVALSMRGLPPAQSVPVLASLATQFDGSDRAYLEAIGLGATGNEAPLYEAILKSMAPTADPSTWPQPLARIAWRLHPDSAIPALKARAAATTLSLPERNAALTAIAFNPSKDAAAATVDLALASDTSIKAMANWWLFNRKGNLWSTHPLDATMKEKGLYDPANVKLQPFEMPPTPKDAPALPNAPEIARLEGDAKRGETAAAVCLSCHSIKGKGIEFGPDLTTFGRQQTREVIIQGIAHPSAEISHGFEGSILTTKDGMKITGIVLSNADPVIIKSMGGVVQNVPKSKVAGINPLGRSLMYDPSTLGLTPQSISDIATYLKGL